jgi:hypothetical protein
MVAKALKGGGDEDEIDWAGGEGRGSFACRQLLQVTGFELASCRDMTTFTTSPTLGWASNTWLGQYKRL